MKNKIHDRVRFNKMKWTDALTPALKECNSTVHSSTRMTPTEAHKDDNEINVKVNLTLRAKNKIIYPRIEENDKVKVFQKKRGNYTERRTYRVAGINKPLLRHDFFGLVND